MLKEDFIKKYSGEPIKLNQGLLVRVVISISSGNASTTTETEIRVLENMSVIFNGDFKEDDVPIAIVGIGTSGSRAEFVCSWHQLLGVMQK